MSKYIEGMRALLVSALLLAGCGGAPCPEPRTAAPAPCVAEAPGPEPVPTSHPPSGSLRVHPTAVEAGPMGGYVLTLEEDGGGRQLPVLIGQSEALVIDLRLRGERFERPLTHDLLSTMLERLGAEVLFVHVDKLESSVFVGSVVLWDGHELQTFDARTSDAIAIALGHDAPIYVSPAVFLEAGEPVRPAP